MKNLALGLAVLVALGLFYIQQRQLRNYKDTSQLQAVELSMFKDSVKTIQQKNGDLSFQIKSVEVEKRNLRESLEIAAAYLFFLGVVILLKMYRINKNLK